VADEIRALATCLRQQNEMFGKVAAAAKIEKD
jgi:hypothetical protein